MRGINYVDNKYVKDRVEEMWNRGCTKGYIARETKVHPKTINKILEKLGIEF